MEPPSVFPTYTPYNQSPFLSHKKVGEVTVSKAPPTPVSSALDVTGHPSRARATHRWLPSRYAQLKVPSSAQLKRRALGAARPWKVSAISSARPSTHPCPEFPPTSVTRSSFTRVLSRKAKVSWAKLRAWKKVLLMQGFTFPQPRRSRQSMVYLVKWLSLRSLQDKVAQPAPLDRLSNSGGLVSVTPS